MIRVFSDFTYAMRVALLGNEVVEKRLLSGLIQTIVWIAFVELIAYHLKASLHLTIIWSHHCKSEIIRVDLLLLC